MQLNGEAGFQLFLPLSGECEEIYWNCSRDDSVLRTRRTARQASAQRVYGRHKLQVKTGDICKHTPFLNSRPKLMTA